jgi:hypothetical protein
VVVPAVRILIGGAMSNGAAFQPSSTKPARGPAGLGCF